MASGSFDWSAGQYTDGRCLWVTQSNGSAANSSKITASVYYKRKKNDGNTWGTYTGSMAIAGNSKSYTGSLSVASADQWVYVFSHEVTVPHAADGTLTTAIAVAGGIPGTGLSHGSVSGSVTADTIPRYAAIKRFEPTQVGLDFAIFAWETDAVCDWGRTYLDNNTGDRHTNTPGAINATAGSFTYTGMHPTTADPPSASTLKPNTTYTLKLEVRRKDSLLRTTSGAKTFTTLPIATITNPNVNFTIGDNLALAFANYGNNKSYLALDVQSSTGTWSNVSTTSETIQQADYTWDLSSLASTLYGLVKDRVTANVRVRCGATVNGIKYENITPGVMKVAGSTPTFSIFDFANKDATTVNIMGNTTHMPLNRGNMVVDITTANKATGVNQATITKYVCQVTIGGVLRLTKEAAYSSTATVSIALGSFNATGTATIAVYAVDSRGTKSLTVSKTFTVVAYTEPRATILVYRVNNFEREVSINIDANFSRLLVGSTEKNSGFTIGYRYAEAGANLPSTYTNITPLTLTNVNNDTKRAQYSRDGATNPFVTLDVAKTYNFEFRLTDKLANTYVNVTVAQGVPIMAEYDNGYVTVGRTADFASPAKFQTETDILISDSFLVKKSIDDLTTKVSTEDAKKQNLKEISTTGSNGTTGYIKIASINVKKTYANKLISFLVNQRGVSCKVAIHFKSVNAVNPSVDHASCEVIYGLPDISYVATSTSTDIYVKKSEPYDVVSIHEVINDYTASEVTITWGSTQVSALPSGAVKINTPILQYTAADLGINTSVWQVLAWNCTKIGNMVHLNVELYTAGTVVSNNLYTINTAIPTAIRPKASVFPSATAFNGSFGAALACTCVIEAGGLIKLAIPATDRKYIGITVSYKV